MSYSPCDFCYVCDYKTLAVEKAARFFKFKPHLVGASTKMVRKQVVLVKWAWCVGCNPPSVVCGIRLIGLPAPLVDYHQRLFALSTCRTAVSPLPLGIVGIMHASSSLAQVDVSFLLRCQGSRLTPLEGIAILRVGGVSSNPNFGARKPHTNSPAQPKKHMRSQ